MVPASIKIRHRAQGKSVSGFRRWAPYPTLSRTAAASQNCLLTEQPLESLLQELALGVLGVGCRRDAGRQFLLLAEDLLEALADDRFAQRASDELAIGLRLHVRQRTGETKRNLDLAFRICEVLRFAQIGDHVVGKIARRDER